MKNDRLITICAAGSRKSTVWTAQAMMWSELVDKLKVPSRSTETLAEYLRWSKTKQDDAKDVGGYVAGTLRGTRRKADAVTGRDVVTLDLDNIPSGATDDTLSRLEALGCAYVVYSTRKHSPDKPRLRVLLPLSRTVTADEYEPIARRVGEWVGLTLCDPTTFEPSRLMYWPSCSSDSVYVYHYRDAGLLDADGTLATYTDWRSMAEWPLVPGEQRTPRTSDRQIDPTTKKGIVGAFCRAYDIPRAMDELLPGVYSPCEDEGRYTFTGGSTAGGAVVYDDGKWLFSHHATDPTSGLLVNAWDLVRLHLFGGKDDDVKADTPANRMPSFLAMAEFANELDDVKKVLNQDRYDAVSKSFSPLSADERTSTETNVDDLAWMERLRKNPATGGYIKCMENIKIVLESDPQLKGRIRRDVFRGQNKGIAPLPWEGRQAPACGEFDWTDADDAGLRGYVEALIGIRSKDIVDDALTCCRALHSYNPVMEYLKALEWDGVERLDTLFVDYLGATDSPYTRAVTRKAFTAAVARAMLPGVKFDTMTILSGPQGLGKSTLLRKMGGEWFTDGISNFEGKEAKELVRGAWICEIAELEAFAKSDVLRIKQFLSQVEDRFRAAYGRNVETNPRTCVFFGTTNSDEYLRDYTGGRRFWPVDTGTEDGKKDVFADLDGEVDQIWAEAVTRWKAREPLFLTGELAKAASHEQEVHREHSAKEGQIIDFVNRMVPEGWSKMDLQSRRIYWAGGDAKRDVPLVPRDRVCALEIWCELFDRDAGSIQYKDSFEINGVMERMEGWTRAKTLVRCGYCGHQRGFVKEG